MKESLAAVSFEGLKIDRGTENVWLDQTNIALTRTEFHILCLLAFNVDQTYGRREIIDFVNDEHYPASERTVDVHINGLRKKLRQYGSWIKVVRGKGYKFQPSSEGIRKELPSDEIS